MTIEFDDITNQMAQLIKNDADLTQYCNDHLSGALNIVDNTNFADGHAIPYPACEINKINEDKYSNDKSQQMGRSYTWHASITFLGEFKGTATGSEVLVLPAGAKEVINGIDTNMPANHMRKVASKARDLIEKQIGCVTATQGVLLYDSSIVTDDYYADSDGVVGSLLTLELYKKSSIY